MAENQKVLYRFLCEDTAILLQRRADFKSKMDRWSVRVTFLNGITKEAIAFRDGKKFVHKTNWTCVVSSKAKAKALWAAKRIQMMDEATVKIKVACSKEIDLIKARDDKEIAIIQSRAEKRANKIKQKHYDRRQWMEAAAKERVERAIVKCEDGIDKVKIQTFEEAAGRIERETNESLVRNELKCREKVTQIEERISQEANWITKSANVQVHKKEDNFAKEAFKIRQKAALEVKRRQGNLFHQVNNVNGEAIQKADQIGADGAHQT